MKEVKKYQRAIDNANWDWYLAIDRNSVIAGQNPDDYCKRHGIELKVTIPDDLDVPYEKTEKKLIKFCKDVELARQGFELGKHKKSKKIMDGVFMERII